MKFFEVLNESLSKDKIKSVLTGDVMTLMNLFDKNGFELRIVGGTVRDLLLGKDPKDIDFATDATPNEMIAFLEEAGRRVIPTGLQHGTISVLGEHDEPYEITTLRIDKETDGRHAEVEFTRDFEEDALRRDLTFNAMSIDMNGKVYDYFNGMEDLKKGQAKFVGNTSDRIQEDYLRILRYFRFQGRMPKPTFDKETLTVIKENASGLNQISGERIWAEMQKILVGKHVETILRMMVETGINEPAAIPTQIDGVDKVSYMTNNPVTVLAFITPNAQQMEETIARWKLSNPEKKLYAYLLNKPKPTMQEAKKLVAFGDSKEFVAELFFMHGDRNSAYDIMQWIKPEFPISGQDLKNIGMKPGPEFGKTLSILKDIWVDSGFEMDKNELLAEL